ncbi:MAG: rhodanese-like domain-containing protein [Pseudomonadota bacterium]
MESFVLNRGRRLFKGLRTAALTTVVVAMAAYAGEDASVVSQSIASDAVDLGDANLVVLDVRTGGEFSAGHIEGAVHMPIASDDFSKQIAKLDKSKSYVVHCTANPPGGRAERAIDTLRDAGFSRVQSLEGGYHGWLASDRSVTTGKED